MDGDIWSLLIFFFAGMRRLIRECESQPFRNYDSETKKFSIPLISVKSCLYPIGTKTDPVSRPEKKERSSRPICKRRTSKKMIVLTYSLSSKWTVASKARWIFCFMIMMPKTWKAICKFMPAAFLPLTFMQMILPSRTPIR